MKKTVLLMLSMLMLLTGCATYTGQGAAAGGAFGSIIGSAIGGISGGRRGSNVGTLIGLAGGAAVGAAIGSAADRKVEEAERRRYEGYRYAQESRNDRRYDSQSDNRYDNQPDGRYDNGSNQQYDDRIDFDAPGPRDGKGTYSAASPHAYTPTTKSDPGYRISYNSLIEIRNARIIDADHDGVLKAGEECKVTFEVMNNSSKTLYDVQPTVFDVTGNKHIHISPNLHVESIAPNSGIRYTATILAGPKLKDGTIVVRIAVAQGNKEITSQVQEFTIRTQRK